MTMNAAPGFGEAACHACSAWFGVLEYPPWPRCTDCEPRTVPLTVDHGGTVQVMGRDVIPVRLAYGMHVEENTPKPVDGGTFTLQQITESRGLAPSAASAEPPIRASKVAPWAWSAPTAGTCRECGRDAMVSADGTCKSCQNRGRSVNTEEREFAARVASDRKGAGGPTDTGADLIGRPGRCLIAP
jgi:hypothetical protein